MKKDFMIGLKKNVVDAHAPSFSEIEKIKKSILIIDSLKEYIPPLTREEFIQLEENIKKYGCKDPLSVWETIPSKVNIVSNSDIEEKIYILVDGHNRLKICLENNIDFRIALVEFDNISAAQNYMIEYQLGRRNLNPEQMAYYRGLRYNREKGVKGKYDRISNTSVDIAQKLAQEHKVSVRTIKNDGLFAEGIDKLPKSVKADVLSGKSKLTKVQIQNIGKNKVNSVDNNLINADSIKQNTTYNLVELKKDVLSLAKKLNTKDDCEKLISLLNILKKQY